MKIKKMLIIDEVSFLDDEHLQKLDKNMRKLKEKDVLYGGVLVVFVGDFFQMLPVKGSPLFKRNTLQFNAINCAVFLNKSHRFSQDPEYGEIMRRFRIGKVTRADIEHLNSRFIENEDIFLPQLTDIRCACYMNDERNAYNNVVFMEHLKATHPKEDQLDIPPPMHTCIIKANMRHGSKSLGNINTSMYNHILDQCGDSDITNGSGAFVDPALKFFFNIPLMMNTNERIDEELANGTPCRGLYIHLKKGCDFVRENWEGYIVNTVLASQVDYILCMHEGKDDKYFKVKPETKQCKIRLRQWNNTVIDKIKTTYLPISSSISTTGHKLQGKTLDSLVVNSWGYRCAHWVYVVLSRVRQLNNLVLNVKLDPNRDYSARDELVRWERYIKDNVESETFKMRGPLAYEKYKEEEDKYCSC